MKYPRLRRVAGHLAAFAAAGAAQAQWSADPAVGLPVADAVGDQVQAKVIARPGGGYFVSWFDNRSGGFDVYLQRLDAQGVEQLPHNGVLVADRSFGSTQDYGLGVDTAGNALLTFRDDRSGSVQISAAKVAPDGTLAWGAGGIQLTSGADFFAAPKIVGTADGEAMVAWKANNDVKLQRLDAGGVPVFASDIMITDPGGMGYSVSDLQAADAGSAIVSVVFEPGGFLGPKHLYAQKYSATGATQWGTTPLAVFDGGSLQFGNFPSFVPDGSGGGVFTWYNTAGELQCYAQRVLAAGTEAFPHNGTAVSTAPRNRVNPDVAFDSATGSTFVFWREELPGGTPQFGIFGQRFDAGGSRQWGDGGIAVASLTSTEVGFPRVVHQDAGATVFWIRTNSFSDQTNQAARLDNAGNSVWATAVLEVATVASGKSRPWAVGGPDAFALLAWSDNRSGDDDVYAQNMNNDGTLGAVDSDGDAVPDDADNCTEVPNPGQRDTNGDGYGNICDADLTNDGTIDFLDLGQMRLAFFSTGDLDADLNGDGSVDFLDLGLMKQSFFGMPGPSGLAP